MLPEEDLPNDLAGDEQREKPKGPSLTSKAVASKAERAERVAAEMRNNLLKRKQQQREKRQEP